MRVPGIWYGIWYGNRPPYTARREERTKTDEFLLATCFPSLGGN